MDEAPSTMSPHTANEIALFTFDGRGPAWYSVNDDVMGGVSSSKVSTDTWTQRLAFSGNLSLENNGGFTSARSPRSNYDLARYDGIILRLRGDGNTYQFRVRTGETGAPITYTTWFETEPGSWKEIYVPFAAMTPIYRGAQVGQAPALDPGAIRSFGFMLAGKQAGEFFLEVEGLSAVAVGHQQIEEARINDRV